MAGMEEERHDARHVGHVMEEENSAKMLNRGQCERASGHQRLSSQKNAMNSEMWPRNQWVPARSLESSLL